MSPAFVSATVEVTPYQAAAMLEQYGAHALRALIVSGKASAGLLASRTIKQRLSGQVLKRVTGTLQRSVAASPRAYAVSEKEAQATYGTHLDYGIAHEQGFEGTVTVRAHQRRPGRVSARALRGAEDAAGVVNVRSHQRQVRVTAKWYLRDTLQEGHADVRRLAVEALDYLIRTGQVPKASDLGVGGLPGGA